MGSKEKFWTRMPDDDVRWLFKYSRPRVSGPSGGHNSAAVITEYAGEHWAEKIAAEIAAVLGIPHATVELAKERESHAPGAISRDITADVPHGELIHGNDLLVELDASYPKSKQYHTHEHTIDHILRALSRPFIELPAGLDPPSGVREAPDLFVGYLMLDALIGNTDRHHENWAFRRSWYEGELIRTELAPSYDHASSLGRELSDDDRARRLRTRDERATVEAYARKARSAIYRDARDARPMTPLMAFVEAAIRRTIAGRSWHERLREVPAEALDGIVERVPDEAMSTTAGAFALRLLRYNRQQILEQGLAR